MGDTQGIHMMMIWWFDDGASQRPIPSEKLLEFVKSLAHVQDTQLTCHGLPLPQVIHHPDGNPSIAMARYAPKDAKKGGLVAKGAAPSRDLVRTGIENVLKEVLGVSMAATDGNASTGI